MLINMGNSVCQKIYNSCLCCLLPIKFYIFWSFLFLGDYIMKLKLCLEVQNSRGPYLPEQPISISVVNVNFCRSLFTNKKRHNNWSRQVHSNFRSHTFALITSPHKGYIKQSTGIESVHFRFSLCKKMYLYLVLIKVYKFVVLFLCSCTVLN